MGIDINGVELLIAAHKKGVRFDRSVMLGRSILNVFPKTLEKVLERNGLPAEKFKNAGPECAYAESFFETLGVSRVDVMGNSDHEGAKFVHDLNQHLKNREKH